MVSQLLAQHRPAPSPAFLTAVAVAVYINKTKGLQAKFCPVGLGKGA